MAESNCQRSLTGSLGRRPTSVRTKSAGRCLSTGRVIRVCVELHSLPVRLVRTLHEIAMFVWSTPRLWSVVLLSVVAAGASPAPVSACDYGYMALPQVFDASTDVFVGTVTESRFSRGVDGQLIVRSRPTEDVPTVRFKVLTPYKGAAGDEVILSEDLSDCTFPFLQGATYMIHAF